MTGIMADDVNQYGPYKCHHDQTYKAIDIILLPCIIFPQIFESII